MSARVLTGGLAAGRVALGAAVLAAPGRVTARWVGASAEHPVVRYFARSLGARDVVLGILVLQTLDDSRLGPRVQAACAVADSMDTLATVAARSDLPASGVIGTVAVAGAAGGAGFYLAHKLARA